MSKHVLSDREVASLIRDEAARDVARYDAAYRHATKLCAEWQEDGAARKWGSHHADRRAHECAADAAYARHKRQVASVMLDAINDYLGHRP